MSEPKALFANDDTAAKVEAIKAEHERLEFEAKQKLPKPLDFANVKAVTKPLNVTAPVPEKIKPLDLSHVSTPVPHAAPNPGSLFAEKPVPWVSAAIKLAHEKFGALGGTNLESVERQIKMLLPFNITTVITWGEPSVSQEADMVTKAANLIKMFSELRSTELCENALKASTQVPSAHFWPFTKGSSIIGYKPNLIALKSSIMSTLPTCDEFTTKIDILHMKLAINLAALSSASDAVGTIEDSSLSMTVDNRRRILAQCVQQSDLTTQQLKQMKNLMIQQMSQVSQLLDVTIPAIESANATR